MGKGTDKLYITHSEWSSSDAFGPSAGANARQSSSISGASFKRLPFNFCALSLQPFSHPVCTADGTVFDLTNILPWIKKHDTNPVNGQVLKSSDLIKLHFAKNDDGQHVDPVTFKVLTDNTHIVALRNTGNVFAYETVERLNIKAKIWRDLVSDEEFKRADIITLQDPQNVASRDLSQYKYLRDGVNMLTPEQEAERAAGVKVETLGSAAKILKAKEAVDRRRAEREKAAVQTSGSSAGESKVLDHTHQSNVGLSKTFRTTKALPYNAAQHTTGRAAASFTSTGLTPSTSTERAILTDEEYMLKPKRVKIKGYARMTTTHGDLTIELYPEYAPKSVWNFIQLSKKGYYNGVSFHRNIKNFMIQGGDPTGTGRGGQSCWGKAFGDEFDGPLTHDRRGVLSMANKGKDTNTSQFFLLYRATPHLNRKHTIFGRVIEGQDTTLTELERIEVDDKNRPVADCKIEEVVIYVDPFEEFRKQRQQLEVEEAKREQLRLEGGAEDEKTTWTGKKIRADGKVELDDDGDTGIGKYLKRAKARGAAEAAEAATELDSESEPATKKRKKGAGGDEFGNFDRW